MKVEAAAVQMRVEDNPGQNCQKIIALMEANRGVDLICFPETSLSGADPLPHRDLWMRSAIAAKAAELNMWACYGLYKQRFGQIFNEAEVVGPGIGRVLTYRKRNLWQEESVSRGQSSPVVETPIGRLGVMICWDIRWPYLVADLASKTPDIVLCPSYWYGSANDTEDVIEGLALSRAFDLQSYFVYTDAYTPKTLPLTEQTSGQSKIASPLHVLAAAAPGTEETISATLDLDVLTKYRRDFNSR